MFRSLLGKVMEKLTNLSPVQNLIKYVLDRTLNQFLTDRIAIQDFKNIEDGRLLLLSNISLNLQKINTQFLLSSPYILHNGSVNKLRIKLPNLSQLSSKSIQLTVQGLQLDFKPNKQFAQKFRTAMNQQKQNVVINPLQQPGQITQNSPMNFFRQLVRQIILNMVIKIQNLAVRLFINQPSNNNANKPQYYLLFRMPSISIGKAQDAAMVQQHVQQVKFDLILPQMSVHLLRQGIKFPQYSNINAKPQDFPILYPHLNHPSTIFLLGRQDKNIKQAAKLKIKLLTNYKQQKKQLSIEGSIASFQITIDPIQMKIVSRFIAQINQFKKVLQSVMKQLGLIQNQSYDISKQSISHLQRQDSNKSSAIDIFSSIIHTVVQRQPKSSGTIDVFKSIANQPKMANNMQQFNKDVTQQIKKSGESMPEQGYGNINFKQQIKISFNLNKCQINILKYVNTIDYQRRWVATQNQQIVNNSLNSSHFRIGLKDLCYSFKSNDKKHKVTMKFATIHDVRMFAGQKSLHQSVGQQFFDIDSSTYYTTVSQDYFLSQPNLKKFNLVKGQHFCMQQIFRVSSGFLPNINQPNLKRYSFMPEHEPSNQDGLILSFNSINKALKIQVKQVALMVNFEVWKDVLNIIYPIFLYKQIVKKSSVQGQQISYDQQQNQNYVNAFQSIYEFKGSFIEEVESKQKSINLKVIVNLAYLLYRQNNIVGPKQNLILQVQNKNHDCDNFSKQCFCNLSSRALYCEAKQFVFQKQSSDYSIDLHEFKTGFISLKNSKINSNVNPIAFVSNIRVQEFKDKEQTIINRTYVKKVKLDVQLAQLITFVDMIKKMIGTIDTLIRFQKSLNSKLLCIDLQNKKISKTQKQKIKQERIIQILVKNIQLKTILLNSYINRLYFKKDKFNMQIMASALAVGLLKQNNVSLCQFKNEPLFTAYPQQQHYYGISNSALLLQIGRHNASSIKQNLQINNQIGKRKLQFFKHIKLQQFSVSAHLRSKLQAGPNKRNQFQFNKNTNKAKKQIIEEQQHSKSIQILLGQPLTFHIVNILTLSRQRSLIQKIISDVSIVLQQIKRDSLQILQPQRKGSVQIQLQGAEQTFKINSGEVILDFRPQFMYDLQKRQQVLSNTRLITSIHLDKFSFTIKPELHLFKFDVSIKLQTYFLHHQDRDIQTNPILILKQQLLSYGFRKICRIGQVTIKGQFKNKPTLVGTLEGQIEDINIDICVSSIPSLQLFVQHLVKHSIQGRFSDQYGNDFQILQNQVQEIIDLTQQLNSYELKIQKNKQMIAALQQTNFQTKKPNQFKGVQIKKFIIHKIKINFYGGNQFQFAKCNSLYQSKSIVRVRSQQPNLKNYLLLQIINLQLVAYVGEQNKFFTELQSLAIDFSYQKTQGIVWKQQKQLKMSILKIQKPLKIILFTNKQYLQAKLSHFQLTVGFTDHILSFGNDFSKAALKITNSKWKKLYKIQNAIASKKQLIVILPKGKLVASVQYKNMSILNDRILNIKSLTIQDDINNSPSIVQTVETWIKQILKQNLNTLVTGTLFEVISGCVGMFIGAISHFFTFFIGNQNSK